MTDTPFPYEDIIHHPAPRPINRQALSRADRAAQFSAFAALSGHSEAIRETERITEPRPELSGSALAELDSGLRRLAALPGSEVRLTWFAADAHKPGGACCTERCTVRRVDAAHRKLLLADGRCLDLADILHLELL